jgi:phage tail sheath protein FI
MLSNARGKHSSPGVYIEEIDMPYAVNSLGGTILGLAGETLKGPAFEPVLINDWNEFQDYFGGTSTEKFKGTNYPKYEAPYIAKSFLQESKQLQVCRILGFSGYNAGPWWAIVNANDPEGNKQYTDQVIVGILRSDAIYSTGSTATTECNGEQPTGNDVFDAITFKVSAVSMTTAATYNYSSGSCENSITTTDGNLNVYISGNTSSIGRFVLNISGTTVGDVKQVTVSLNPADKDYILNVLGNKPNESHYGLYVEELYDNIHLNTLKNDNSNKRRLFLLSSEDENKNTLQHNNYLQSFLHATTPWFVSELKGNDVKKLFRFNTISDGDCANHQIKISIANILPDEGLFDVLIRDFNDTDVTPMILERYTRCNLIPGTNNYLGLKIGTSNGEYVNKSKYVTVEFNEQTNIEGCVPCGFLGYPMRTYYNNQQTGTVNYDMVYNLDIQENIKINRQYFGLSEIAGIDVDLFKYKGFGNYGANYNTAEGYTNGFHLDSRITSATTVDGAAGYKFHTVSSDVFENETIVPLISDEETMGSTIYNDKRLRKFTCCPYGGFDGWDIHRDQRSNTKEFKANTYKGTINANNNNLTADTLGCFTYTFNIDDYDLSGKVISSDYYAYLAAYKQFNNPNKVKINLLATPGIDYLNNKDLVHSVIDIIEEERQGDCLYIVTTPDTDKDGTFLTPSDVVANLEDSDINTSYAATYYPWVKYYDSVNKKYINLPATKDVVRNLAYTDNVSQPWFATAGMSRGNVDCVKASLFTKLEEEDVLYEGMINPIKTFSSDGVKIWGNKTMYFEDTPLNRINVRRLMIRIKDLVTNAAKQLIFEQNDNTIEQQFRSIIDPILADAKQKRGISDYKIKTDTSAEARDRKELPAKIWVKPINCLEYIPISFVITPEGSNFEE